MHHKTAQKLAFCFLAFCLFTHISKAQKTALFTDENIDYKRGLDLFDKEKFSAAKTVFKEVANRIDDDDNELSINAQYYHAVSALNLFNKDADFLLRNFVYRHPESPWTKIAYHQLGKYHYRKRKFKKAIPWFEKVDTYDLTQAELNELNFKKGYSYFDMEDYENASAAFYDIKDPEDPYYVPGKYYYSHIAYENGNYETALIGFKEIEDNENFAEAVPFYIAQIYFIQEKYEELTDYAPPLLDSKNTKRTAEIAKLLGESFYRQKKYQEAIPYLKEHLEAAQIKEREDIYQLGHVFYLVKDYENAVDVLELLTFDEDRLTQLARYEMADAYMKLGKKQRAANAFYDVSQSDFDQKIKADAAYNYAKLSFELDDNPFRQATNTLTDYLNEYPNSNKKDEVYGYLTKIYASTKNYDEALKAIEKIDRKNYDVKLAWQAACFNKGIDLFYKKQYQNAINSFKKAKRYAANKKIAIEADYWSAECLYRQKKYKEAIDEYEAIKLKPTVYLMPFYNRSNYNIGYAYFQQKDYDNALTNFRLLTQSNNSEPKLLNDAYLRTGDCFYVKKDYKEAANNYDKAAKINQINGDYALYQKAICLGLQDKYNEEVTELSKLLDEYPGSKYRVDGTYRLGETYLRLGNNDKALTYLEKITNNKNSPGDFMKRSLLQAGLIYYKKGQNNKAKNTLKKVINNYPSAVEAKEAASRIGEIFVAEGDIDGLNTFLGTQSATSSEVDELNYQAAENLYLENDCIKAISAFTKYINRFPDGKYILDARYYRGECALRKGNKTMALEDFNAIIAKEVNDYTESALVSTSSLNYDSKNYNAALQNYIMLEQVASSKSNVLEAQIGQMRCHYKQEDFANVINHATAIINDDQTPDEILLEAKIFKAKSLFALEQWNQAMSEFIGITNLTNNQSAAEARYYVALINFKKEDYAATEKLVYELVKHKPSYNYWNAKGLILLSNAYWEMGDNFQAKATLESIISNYQDGQNMIDEAQALLDKIIASEQQPRSETLDDLEINLDKIDNLELFEEEEETNEE